jgi:uncharacterized membrane protein
MKKNVLSKREQTRQMTILAMFIAIIGVLSLVPNGAGGTLGYIKIAPNIEATIVHIPVLIGAALLGRKFGIYLGLAFGILSNIAAFLYVSPYFMYPWVAVLPRFIFGLLIYDVTRFFVKVIKNKFIAIGTSFFVLTFIHTLIVLPMWWTSFALVQEMTLLEAIGPFLSALVAFLIPVSSLAEMVIAAIVGSILVVRLSMSIDLPTSNYLIIGSEE